MSGGYDTSGHFFSFLIQQNFIDGSSESRLVCCTYDDLRLASLRNEDDGRERLDTHGHGQFLFLVCIYLVDNDTVAIFLSQILQDRGYHSAWSAPGGIEIDYSRLVALVFPFGSTGGIVEYFLQEHLFVHLDNGCHFFFLFFFSRLCARCGEKCEQYEEAC